MRFINEPKSVDLIVAPSILTEDTKKNIQEAIAQYKKTGKKPENAQYVTHGPLDFGTQIGNTNTVQNITVARRSGKVKV